MLCEYDSTIKGKIRQGIMEPVEESSEEQSTQVHSYHTIRWDKEMAKVRIVYNELTRADGPSLNDCLYTSPKFNQNFFDKG